MSKKDIPEALEIFFPFSPEEKSLIGDLGRKLPLKEIWNEVYEYARRHPKGREILEEFSREGDLDSLAHTGARFFTTALEDLYAPEFLAWVKRVAAIHLGRGVEPGLLMGALESLKARLFAELQKRGLFDASKVLLFSRFFTALATLMLQEYHRLMQEEISTSLELIKRKNRFLGLLRDINLLIFTENLSEDELFEKACAILVRKGEVCLAWAALFQNGQVKHKGGYPKDHPYFRALKFEHLGEMKAEGMERELELLLSGKPLIVNDVTRDMPPSARRDRLLAHGFRSVALVPLFLEEKVAGTLFLYHPEPNHFLPDEVQLLAEIGRDISVGLRHIRQRKRLEEALFRDELTGLGNERFFVSNLPNWLLSAQQSGKRCAVIRLDIVNFSHLNDLLGYVGGDEVLRETARRLQEVFGNSFGISRTGPDEFAICHQFSDLEELHRLVEVLDEVLRKPFTINERSFRVSFGIGVSVYPDDSFLPFELFEKASVALKEVYRQAEGGISFYAPESGSRILYRLRLLSELEQALGRDDLILFFQPRVDLISRTPVAFEGLLRWKHPQKGTLTPYHFISVLEESELMIEVGYRVVEKAIEFLFEARKIKPDLRVSVNASVRQLQRTDFPEKLISLLAVKGLGPRDLEIEITENILLDEKAERTVRRLVEMGFRLALDDFGTGYSSFGYLQNMRQVDLKIDRSFISKVPDNRDQVALVMAMVSMARALSQRTVAEGVETREQLAFITGLGVNEAQGFYFAKPLPPAEALSFLKDYEPEKFFW